MQPVFVRWKCSGCGEMNMVSVPSGYVWEKELACRTCHEVFTEGASSSFQIPIHVESHPKHRPIAAARHKH